VTETPRIYTVTQLAEILRLRPATVRTNARTGKWPYLKFGERTMRFTEEHLTTILTASEATPPERPTGRRRRRTT
jgi:hypothetical protein